MVRKRKKRSGLMESRNGETKYERRQTRKERAEKANIWGAMCREKRTGQRRRRETWGEKRETRCSVEQNKKKKMRKRWTRQSTRI